MAVRGFGNAVGASSVRSILVANNYHTGVSAKRLLDFGLPLQDEIKGLVALQSDALSSRGLTMERAYLSHGFFGTANAMNVYAMATLGTDPCIYSPIYPDPSPPPSPPAPVSVADAPPSRPAPVSFWAALFSPGGTPVAEAAAPVARSQARQDADVVA